MKVSKTDNRFKTGFLKPVTGLPKKQILTSLVETYCLRITFSMWNDLSFCRKDQSMMEQLFLLFIHALRNRYLLNQ